MEESLEKYGEMVEESVKEYLERFKRESSEYHSFVGGCYSDLEEFVLRKGKRIASCSTLLAYRGYADGIGEDILTVCAGIELYRHAILIHDDMVDMDVQRRGGKTMHRNYSEDRDGRFGRGTATFLGNIAFSLAERAIEDSGFSEEKKATVLSLVFDHYREVNESQILDLLFEYKDVDVAEWRTMALKRAASLFKLTLLSGAVLGGAPEKDLETLEEAGENIGYSFDIQDDIIDTFAEEDQYGREPCRDIRLGKKPLHVIQALGRGSTQKAEELGEFLGKDELSSQEIERIRELIREAGGLESAKETSRSHAEKGKKLIMQTSMDDESKDLLNSTIDYVVESLEWYK